jgi:hypothetical protein
MRLEQSVSGYLADCRAYEMVTPPYKAGYELETFSFASDGERAIIGGLADLAGNPGGGESTVSAGMYLDQRTAVGWQLLPLNAPLSQFVGQIPLAEEAGDGDTLWDQHTPAQSPQTRGLYVRSAEGQYSYVGPLNVPVPGEEEYPSDVMETELNGAHHFDLPIGATADYSHVILEGEQSGDRWPFDGTVGLGSSLYEYNGTGNTHPVLVGVSGAKGSTSLIGECGVLLGSGLTGSAYNALSASGETVFVTVVQAGCGGVAPVTAEVFARLHGGVASPEAAETVDVSAGECTPACSGGESGKNFEGASENGEKAFFTSTQKLTNDAVSATASANAAEGEGCAVTVAGEGGCNLYEYDFGLPGSECQELHKCLRLVSGGQEVLGVAGIAENGARVYFVARGVVAGSGVNENGKSAVAGEPNLYVYDSETGSTTYIATLSSEDERAWVREFRRPVEVTGEGGRFLLFASSTENLTSEDATSAVQLFEYDAVTKELVRVTQGEHGYENNGQNVTSGVGRESIQNVSKEVGDFTDFKSSVDRLNVGVDGRTVVFRTRGVLSPFADGASVGCFSLYEFRTGGLLRDGVVSLVSDGEDVSSHNGSCGTEFQGIDADAGNILFGSANGLLSSDVDGGQRDIYDARVGGGFPSSVSEASCGGIGCEGPSSTSPVFSAPGSSSSSGSGNFAPPPQSPSSTKTKPKPKAKACKRGQVRSHGKCVKTSKKKQAKAKKSNRRDK